MSRFYFHLKNKGKLVRDDEGVELDSFDDAKREALQGAREMLVEAIKHGGPVPDVFVIADEAGRTVHELALVEALPEQFRSK